MTQTNQNKDKKERQIEIYFVAYIRRTTPLHRSDDSERVQDANLWKTSSAELGLATLKKCLKNGATKHE